ncbi:MAG: excinuclease ABC subunit UvrC [Chloroflexi bacterium]|nr:excinuclease ABC subunit UvrC [Chloroflexota bacterium]
MEQKPLEEQLKAIPSQPGVYIFRDTQGDILYVGKAASLRHRIRSYFGSPWSLQAKIQKMVSKMADFEFIITHSEQEALILENNLIKRHKPRYNSRLKDDKNYPYLKIDLKEDFPLVYITRRQNPDGARYFGPFASAGSVRKTLDLLKRLFPYRSCTKAIKGDDPRPCLDYYIHRCVGPCIGAVTKEQYREVIEQVISFLEGKHEAVVKDLRQKMEKAAERMEFERAAILRDQIRAIERVTQEQKAVSTRLEDEDVVAMAREKDDAWVEAFFIRQGKLIGRDHFLMEGVQDEEPAQIMASFVKQFYDSASYIPPQILLQHTPEDTTTIRNWLESKRGKRVYLRAPRHGEKKRLVDMVAQNASQGLAQLMVREHATTDAITSALEELKEQLNLPSVPHRVECYDISSIHGTSAVGSMVVFEDGRPKPAHYRRFKIKDVKGIDDYAMMQEVLRRRFKRATASAGNGQKPREASTEPWVILPDLVLIDGGKGHLSAALQVMLQIGLASVPIASIAKENEEVFRPESQEAIILQKSSQALYLLQRIRDEAHRFAISYHQKIRSRKSWGSAMDSVPGIGPKRKRALLRRFGSVQAIKEASLEEVSAVPGMTRALAEKVKEYL